MLLVKNHRHTGMDLRFKLIRLACDNRASSQSLSRFGISPLFSRAGAKVNGRPSFMAKSERQLRLSCFAPFVESVGRNQAATLKKR
jgi:hypothetical protein